MKKRSLSWLGGGNRLEFGVGKGLMANGIYGSHGKVERTGKEER